MNTLICAGGTSQRVLSAVLHLCAAGLGPAELRILVVDPDRSNGNNTEVRQLIETYTRCHERFAGKLGDGLGLFGTKLDLLDGEDANRALKVWSPLKAGQTLADIINYDNLASTPDLRDVANLLFTADEIRMPLEKGFMGHTAVGAAAMSLVALHANEQPWKQVVDKIRQDVSVARGAAVVVVGSVFGGTGASAIHPLVRFLRSVPQTNRERLHIAAIPIVPYFSFDESTARPGTETSRLAAQTQWFPLRTRSAVEYYKHLEENHELDFDALFWVGDNSPVPVNYSEGGPGQRNPAHYVDLIAGLAALEYFLNPEGVKGNYFAGSSLNVHPELEAMNVVDWANLPLRALSSGIVRDRCLRIVLAAGMHNSFFNVLFEDGHLDAEPQCVRWYYQRFARKNDHFSNERNRDDLALLTHYFRKLCLPWWTEVNAPKNSLLFNRSVFRQSGTAVDVQLDRLSNLVGKDVPSARSTDAIDDFVTCMDDVPLRRGGSAGAAAYLSLLAHASDLYMQRVYKKNTFVR